MNDWVSGQLDGGMHQQTRQIGELWGFNCWSSCKFDVEDFSASNFGVLLAFASPEQHIQLKRLKMEALRLLFFERTLGFKPPTNGR